MKIKNDFFNNVKRITGIEPNGPGSLVVLELSVLEELLAYAKTLTTGRLAGFAQQVKQVIFTKKLWSVSKQTTVTFMPGMTPDNVAWDSVTIVGLDKLTEFLESEPQHGKDWLTVVTVVRQKKMAHLEAEREAAEEARAKKQAEELEAIERARAVQAEKDLEKAAAKLEQSHEKLNTEIVAVDQAVSAEKQRMVDEHDEQVESIKREHEQEKQVVVEEIEKEVQEAEEEILAEAREQLEDVDDAAESKLVEMKQEQDEVENEQRTEAIQAAAVIEAEISNTQDEATAKALRQTLADEQAARAKILEETKKAHDAQQQAAVEEARALKEEIEKSASAKIKQERKVGEEKMQVAVSEVEQDKQDLIEKQEKIQEIEAEKVDLEGTIVTDGLEQQKREVEEDKELVDDTTTDDIAEETDATHPRASKEDRVVVSRKTNPNGSSFIKLSVPSDLSPGESDEISVFLKKEVVDLLAQYHQIHKKIEEEGSLEDVSAKDKAVLASAGAEFKLIREQYVQQRREKVLARREKLVAQY